MHFLQVQQPHGFISNDFVFFTAQDRSAALELTEKLDQPHSEIGAIRRALGDKTKINQRISGGSTPLAQAALWGQLGLVKELLANDADVNATNSDGNTPLHLAAFMCHQEVVELLVANGAKLDTKNHRGQSPLDVVNGGWTEDLADFYRQLGVSLSLPVDTTRLQDARPKMAQWLQEVR
jgi:ankyrin repeat protein